MKLNRTFAAVIFLFGAMLAADASEYSIYKRPNDGSSRPKVGLVLAGGGAKGAAHIGAIQYLEELGIPVDMVVGTSMGSIVGGLYSLGYSPADINGMIKDMDWSYYMSSGVRRKYESFATSHRKNSYGINVHFGLGELKYQNEMMQHRDETAEKLLETGEFVNTQVSSPVLRSLPSGFIDGENLMNLFNNLCIGYQDSIDFRNLPIAYACVATNALDGKQEVLTSGRVPLAMRASMAIPMVFSPVEYDGKLLVDGGLVNNFPTDICKEMGADIIIGVELTKGFKADRAEVAALPGMLGQLITIATSGHNAANRRLCDVYIHPDMNGYGTMSFDAASIDTLVQRGYDEAKSHRAELLAIKSMVGSDTKEFHNHRAVNLDEASPIVISQVEMGGVSRKDAAWLLKKWPIPLGESITSEELRAHVATFSGTGAFQSINYFLKPVGDGNYAMRMQFQNSSPHNMSIGLRGDTEEAVALGVRMAFNENTLSGWKATFNARLCYNPVISITGTYSANGFVNFNLGYELRYSHTSFKHQGEAAGESTYRRNRISFFLSDYYSRHHDIKAGIRFDNYIFNSYYSNAFGGGSELDDLSNSFAAFSHYKFDNTDDSAFARHGTKLGVDLNWVFYSFDQDMHEKEESPFGYGDMVFKFASYVTPGDIRLTFIPRVYARQIFGNPSYVMFYNGFGGMMPERLTDQQLPFVGINGYEVSTSNFIGIARLDTRYNFYGNHYLTAAVNHEWCCNLGGGKDAELVSKALGVGLIYSYKTLMGPLSFQIHWSNLNIDSKWGAYLSLGFDF